MHMGKGLFTLETYPVGGQVPTARMARVSPGKKARSERQDTYTHGPHHSLSATLGVELFHEGIDVKLDGVFANLQAVGDNFVGEAFG
jgi:hypothetical protein